MQPKNASCSATRPSSAAHAPARVPCGVCVLCGCLVRAGCGMIPPGAFVSRFHVSSDYFLLPLSTLQAAAAALLHSTTSTHPTGDETKTRALIAQWWEAAWLRSRLGGVPETGMPGNQHLLFMPLSFHHSLLL
jgi:hypothetical protein